ncbi:MAG: LysM peptidoglycan-binding domain-containing protein [Planctomycetes bacterium]|nr:LysM peptidoglycan-binding domain-containing protein [Planctomycetota bacterium]
MGRLEKIVVLTVLFLVAVILAISLNQGDKKAADANPLASVDPNKGVSAGGQAQPGAGLQPAPGTQPVGAMNAAVQPQPSPNQTAPNLNKPAAQPVHSAAGAPAPSAVKPIATLPAGSMLKTREGLEESLFNDLYVYTWKQGDTYPLLAERFYGSQKSALRLRTANEGRTEATLKVGDKIFVPNLEGSTPVVQGNDSLPGVGGASGGLGANAAGKQDAASVKKNGVSADGFYVVQKGDVLGTISSKVYGTSKKWQKIFDANRDVLKDANSLKVGMKLRIPE